MQGHISIKEYRVNTVFGILDKEWELRFRLASVLQMRKEVCCLKGEHISKLKLLPI